MKINLRLNDHQKKIKKKKDQEKRPIKRSTKTCSN